MDKLMKSLRIRALLIFFVVSALIVSTWFRGGFIYGGAEIGLFTLNPQINFEMSRYVWWDAVAPGQLIPQFVSAAPTYFLFYILKLVGLSPQNIQQLFFTSVLFLMGFGVYLLFSDIFDETRKKYALVAGIFYMFNAYTLVQVWHRFLYSTMLLAAVMPLLILFWRKWIKEGKILHLNLFLLINFLSVYIYGNLAAVITVWIALLFISLGEGFFPWQGKFSVKKICLRLLGGLLFWILTDIWWILPAFSIAPGLLSQQHSGDDNLATLVVISRQTIMPYLLQLVNPFYLFLNSELGTIYSNGAFKIIPWIMSGLIFLGLLVSLRIKDYAKYSVIFIISILLAKGAATPFSFPYIFAFQHSYFMGILRNPFEKMGIILPLFGAILFALGIQSFFIWGAKRLGNIATKLAIILIFIALLVYAWPMWGGYVFGTKKWPVKVQVPQSYMEANEWLRQQYESQGVILHLPFSGKDVVTYNWPAGYHGVDQNEILFTTLPSLSRAVGIKRIDDTLSSLTNIFNPPFSKDKNQILRTLQVFNIRFIVLHEDIKWEDKDTYGERGDLLDPKKIKNVLDSLDFLKREHQFGSLVIYKLMDEKFRPILTLTNNIQIVYPGTSEILQILSKTMDKGDIVTPISDKLDGEIIQNVRQTLIFPDKRIDYSESSSSAVIAKANDQFNQLLQIRNFFYSLGDLQSEEVVQDLIYSTQKLSQLSSAEQTVNYQKSMGIFLKKYNPDLNLHRSFASTVDQILRLHLVVLRQVGDINISKEIEEHMVKWELLPQYKTPGTIFKFTVPSEDNYSLLLPLASKGVEIKLNGVNIASESSVIKSNGTYEVSYNSNKSPEDLVIQSAGVNESITAGKILSFNKESPVSYHGRIHLEKTTFINFAQGFHPGWALTLSKGGRIFEVNQHFLGNLYDNIWWVDKIGDFDFKIEFLPQRQVDTGITIALVTVVFLLLTGVITFLKGHINK